jgi:hypothetical protein
MGCQLAPWCEDFSKQGFFNASPREPKLLGGCPIIVLSVISWAAKRAQASWLMPDNSFECNITGCQESPPNSGSALSGISLDLFATQQNAEVWASSRLFELGWLENDAVLIC